MPRRLAQQRMTLSFPEWPFHASRAVSAVAELLAIIEAACASVCRHVAGLTIDTARTCAYRGLELHQAPSRGQPTMP